MEASETTVAFDPPEAEQMAQQIFGIASTELRICEVLMAEEEATVADLNEQLSHDRSTISQHLNHLVDLGMATKRSKNLDGGGRAYVYSFAPPDEIRRNLHLGLEMWTKDAKELADELTQTKIEAMAEQSDETSTSEPDAETVTDTTSAMEQRESDSDNGDREGSFIDRLFDRDGQR